MQLSEALCAGALAGRTETATWVNHFSIFAHLSPDRLTTLRKFSFVETDGILLAKLAKSSRRTSADLVVPHLLRLHEPTSVLLIGSTEHSLGKAIKVLRERYPQHKFAGLNGYQDIQVPESELQASISSFTPAIVIVGLGAGLQERLALFASSDSAAKIVLTCGGYIDQVPGTYYPSWAYPLRLNWLIRLAREPRRLWRRYTVFALRAIIYRRRLRAILRDLPGFDAALS